MKSSLLHHLKFQLLLVGLLLAAWVGLFPPGINTQWIFLIVLLLITGIPHGSLDFYIEQSQAKVTGTSFSPLRFFIRYLLNMFLYAVCWYYFPLIAFLFFILLTAYHFGEIDWPFHHSSPVNSIFFFLMGLFFIVFTITSHIYETAPVLAVITGNFVGENEWILYGSYLMRISGIGIFLFVCCIPFYLRGLQFSTAQIVGWCFQTIAWCVFVYAMPLFIGFAFYFGVWHSLLSFNLIRNQLSLPPNVSGWKQLIIKALPFSLMAFAGIGVLVYWHYSYSYFNISIAYIFMGIAILTLPHLQVFTRLVQWVHLKNRKSKI
ncbi:MAG: Brp/Blh family beta-carotene 15,15'-dioxygenase [Chitinophagia bacterium]